jgi:hypothetical protein
MPGFGAETTTPSRGISMESILRMLLFTGSSAHFRRAHLNGIQGQRLSFEPTACTGNCNGELDEVAYL